MGRYDDEEFKAYEVTDEDFQRATKNASPFAKRRILKKMTKQVRRKARWIGSFKKVPSLLRFSRNGLPEMIGVLDTAKAHGVVREPTFPSNVELVVKQFVWVNKDKVGA